MKGAKCRGGYRQVLYGEWVEKDKDRVVVTENKERFQRLQET